MQAIILAAGMGKRLGSLTKENTKCMVTVNGKCLIDRVLAQLSEIPLKRIILVVGYQGKKLQAHVGDMFRNTPVEYIFNPIYDTTNNIYSLYLAREELQKDDTLLLESDLIFDDTLLQKITENPYPNLALVAKYESWMSGTMVCLNAENDIVDFVTKKNFRYENIGDYYKTVNIYKFSKEFLKSHYVPFLEAYSKALGNNEYYEQVLRVITLLDTCELKALPLAGEKWYEIDDVQDRDIAETLFSEENQLSMYQKRYGGYWRFPQLKDFCYLVNPYFPPQTMRDELKANFDTLLTEYPSGMHVNTLVLAKNFGLKQEHVAIGNGAAELIKGLVERLHGSLGLVYPTFEEYPNRAAGRQLIPFTPQNKDFHYTVEDLKRFFGKNRPDNLLVINPDNPSGNFMPRKSLEDLIAWTKDRKIVLVIDESFVDFAEDGLCQSLLDDDLLEKNPHLIVVKSISKSYGVPGLRLGLVASANTEIVRLLRQDVSIWNINSFAEFYLQIYSKYEEDYRSACRQIASERDRFGRELQQIGYLRPIPSQANYFLCEICRQFTSEELAAVLLRKYNILIKDCGKKTAFGGRNYVRLAVRDTADNDYLVGALKNLEHEVD